MYPSPRVRALVVLKTTTCPAVVIPLVGHDLLRAIDFSFLARRARTAPAYAFHNATPYIAWENKSCGHSPGGRLDTGGCHRTRVAATATDRVREREDGYQWLHYTILGGSIYADTCAGGASVRERLARSRAPISPRVSLNTRVYTRAYVCTDSSASTGERRARARAVHRGRYSRQPSRGGGSPARITRSRERRKRARRRETAYVRRCSTLFSVYFPTSISPIRYRSFANTARCERVRLLYDSPRSPASLFFSLRLYRP